MCDSNTTRRVPASHLAAQAAQQLADIYKWCSCCDQTLKTVLCRRQTNVNTKTTLIRFASYLSNRLIAIYIEDYMKLLKLIIIMYNMTCIAKFYNKFCHSSHWTRPDPTCGSTRPACNSALRSCIWRKRRTASNVNAGRGSKCLIITLITIKTSFVHSIMWRLVNVTLNDHC